MALETVVAVASVVASVAGTAYSAYQSEKAGDEAEKAAKRSAAMQAQQYAIREEQEREKAKRLLATQAARVAGSGVLMEGSPLLGLMETEKEYERQLANIKLGYQWALEETLTKGEAYEKAGEREAYSTLLGGIAKTGAQTYGWMKGG